MKINIRGKVFEIDNQFEENRGIYGRVFWSRVDEGSYEPSTFDFIETYKSKKIFFDIGAATGCMSLFAASLGLKVVAIEPQEEVFDCLANNLNLNPEVAKNIELRKGLVVGSGKVDDDAFFTKGANGPLSPLNKKEVSRISILQLFESGIDFNSSILKMDIEGAEYAILSDSETLSAFTQNGVIVYLSLHPGFTRPLGDSSRGFHKFYWRLCAAIETLILLLKIKKHGTIHLASKEKRINLFRVFSALKSGQKDFVIKFPRV